MQTLSKTSLISLVSLLVINTNVLAQEFFDDNEVRAGILELNKKITETSQRLGVLDQQIKKLTQEKVQLENLIIELENTAKRSISRSDNRNDKLFELLAKFDDELQKNEKRSNTRAELLNNIVEGLDADIYRQALTDYHDNQDSKKALAQLQKIRQLGGLSPYRGPALYWIGKIQFEQGELTAARENLIKFYNGYPKDHREPEVMLMLAKIQNSLDNTQTSTWEELILKNYPDSFAADQVRFNRINN